MNLLHMLCQVSLTFICFPANLTVDSMRMFVLVVLKILCVCVESAREGRDQLLSADHNQLFAVNSPDFAPKATLVIANLLDLLQMMDLNVLFQRRHRNVGLATMRTDTTPWLRVPQHATFKPEPGHSLIAALAKSISFCLVHINEVTSHLRIRI